MNHVLSVYVQKKVSGDVYGQSRIPLRQMFAVNLKSTTKSFNVLLACTRHFITEFADN